MCDTSDNKHLWPRRGGGGRTSLKHKPSEPWTLFSWQNQSPVLQDTGPLLKWPVSVDPTKHRDGTLTRGSSPKRVTASVWSGRSLVWAAHLAARGVWRFALLAEESEESCPGQVMAWNPPTPRPRPCPLAGPCSLSFKNKRCFEVVKWKCLDIYQTGEVGDI